MNTVKLIVNEILGKIDDGILIIVDLEYESTWYECTIWYRDNTYIFTTPSILDDIVNITTLKEFEIEYNQFKQTLPIYEELVNTLEELI